MQVVHLSTPMPRANDASREILAVAADFIARGAEMFVSPAIWSADDVLCDMVALSMLNGNHGEEKQ